MSTLTSLALLSVATLAFSARLVLCQLQAYVLLALGVVALLLYVRADCDQHEHSVVALRSPWCLDCSSISRAAILSGARAARVRSNYERLYWSAPRPYLMLAVWLMWIAYGSLFHSAAHQAHEDEFFALWLRSLWKGWNASDASIVVALFRTLRRFLLLGGALYSILTDYFALTSAPQRSAPGAWHVHAALLFFALLFMPTSGSTAQALDTLTLLARTHLFVALFCVSEQIDAELRYWCWVAQYDSSYRRMLVSAQMALGLVESRSLKSNIDAENIIPDRPPILSGTRLSIAVPLARLSVVVRSAWILFADNSMIFYAELQLIAMLVLVYKLRTRVRRAVATKDSYLRLSNNAHLFVARKNAVSDGFAEMQSAMAMERGDLVRRNLTRETSNQKRQECLPPDSHRANANASSRSTSPDADVRRRLRPPNGDRGSSPHSPKPRPNSDAELPRQSPGTVRRRPSQVPAADELAEYMSQNDESERSQSPTLPPLDVVDRPSSSRPHVARVRSTSSPKVSGRQARHTALIQTSMAI